MLRFKGVWVIQTRHPADLDPLDGSPSHLLLNLPDPNAKDPSAWCLRGLYRNHIQSNYIPGSTLNDTTFFISPTGNVI